MLIRPFELHTDSRDSRAYFIRKLEQQFIQFRYSTSQYSLFLSPIVEIRINGLVSKETVVVSKETVVLRR